MEIFAHSVTGRPQAEWETLQRHAHAVSARAADFADAFGFAEAARLAGVLHDIGKCSAAFQAYLREETGMQRGPDHSTAGAREAAKLHPGRIGRMLAFIIAGHHAGLADGVDLDQRMGKTLEAYDGWEREVGPLPNQLMPGARLVSSSHRGFSESFLTRMLFSCLVDADFIETEAFYQQAERDGFTSLPVLRERLLAYMAEKRAGAKDTSLNALRARILDDAVGKAVEPSGLFTLTVPTGGGKTLASLSFALEHAVRHGLRRIVYVIPFTSIIEQTADVFRNALGEGYGRNESDILEHHANFDWEVAARRAPGGVIEGGRGPDPLDRLRRATENWAAPVVVTTAVQFFESLFANRTSRCRKLHNLARSVIVLDEAQMLPRHLLLPCMAAIEELARNYGTSVVLCTATQPALRKVDQAVMDGQRRFVGLDIDDSRELAPDPAHLYRALKRVSVERLPAPVHDEEIAARFAAQPRMLCIVNTRAHAQALFTRTRPLPGAVHLSTLMCPAHRRAVLAEARARLEAGDPVRIISTSLIEAGVDIDLPEVWRAAAGIDSIAQAAGRCNREGVLPGLGRLVVFEPVDAKAPPGLKQAWEAGRAVLRRSADPLGLEAVRDYFGELYWLQGPEALDAAELDGVLFPILHRIGERARAMTFPFASMARAFRVIEDVMDTVVVPWRAAPSDDTADGLLGRIAAMDRPLAPDLRKLQQYVVSIPRKHRDLWLAAGVLRPVHPALGEALLRFEDLSHYDAMTGIRLDKPQQRSAESNIL